ncbi:MAG TPA: DUF4920 domain-containing protein [Bacteroidetes bacterium]|nr:DUF4920 domain-containing protein [Bacteroidota bacterium]
MLRNLFFLLIMASAVASCNSQPDDTTKETGQPQSFGKLITPDNAIPYAEMVAKMENAESMNVKVKGTVQAVCQAKGCWMNINDAQASNETFVQFEDYGFFMPKDISGREVILEGKVYKEETPVDQLRHFAEDEGKSKEEIEAITEPVEEMKFMATGVLLMPEKRGK